MYRRTAIQVGILGALGGCLFPGQQNPWSEMPDISVDAESVVPGLSFTASVISPFSTSKPAVVRLRLENTSEGTLEAFFGGVAPFTELESTDGGLFLLPTNMKDVGPPAGKTGKVAPTRRIGCWRLTLEPRVNDVAYIPTLAPGDTIEQRYRVLGPPDGPCPPMGEHVFESAEGYHPEKDDPGVGLRVRIQLG